MATLNTIKRKNGLTSYQVQFFIGKSRKTLSLDSKYTAKQAQEIKSHVERIAAALTAGREFSELPRATRGFVEDMTDDLKARFIRAGLLDEVESVTVGEIFKRFIREATNNPDIKESTLKTYVSAQKRFFTFFDEGKLAETITDDDGVKWKGELMKQYAEATVRNSFQRVESVFNWAVKKGLTVRNPFIGLKRGLTYENPDRIFYVPLEWYFKLLDACPDQTWRTLLALCRIGGLRNPSETLLLTWRDLDWANQSIKVHSPKTERYKNKGDRLIPMFPLLRAELKRQKELVGSDCEYVIDKWRDTAANMRTHFRRIIFRAGLREWERTFQNLRASASMDIEEYAKFNRGVAESSWVGHSETIARKHYQQVREEQFQCALHWNEELVDMADKSAGMGLLSRLSS